MIDDREKPVRVMVAGTGSYVPERVLTNAELEKMVETSDEWIMARTGMRERRIARPDEATSDMAAAAARIALADAGLGADELDLIVVATCTPDMLFPSTACLVQSAIGAKAALCYDLSAACSGFLYAMETARAMLQSGLYQNALVVGADKMSAVTDWTDRGTCILFGDGAGACVLKTTRTHRGIMATVAGADGSLGDLLMIPAGGSRMPATHETVSERLHAVKMAGNNVFKHAVRCMTEAGQDALQKAGLTAADVKWMIPHQANMRIIQAISERVEIPMDRIVVNLDRYGNTTAATVPVALDEALRDGRIKRGDVLLVVVFGGGFTWGAMVLEY
jgi:3-oxoacyl-[acyl-carrier-protein] synthase III